MSKESKRTWRYRGYDYLDACPWCGGEMENGSTHSPRGSYWIPNGGTIFNSMFKRDRYLHVQVGQRCTSCDKTILLGKKRSFMNFMEEEPPSVKAKYDNKEE